MRAWILSGLLLMSAACTSPWGEDVAPMAPDALAAAAPVGQLAAGPRPEKYMAELDVDPRTEQFSGKVTIDLRSDAPLSGVWMHGDDLNVSAVEVRVKGKATRATWTEVLPTGVVWVQFPKTLKAKQFSIVTTYSANFDANLSGLFKVTDGDVAYALAKFESIQARRMIPSFDEPGLKAPFKFWITVPEGMHAIHNTPETSREKSREGFEKIGFAETRPLSTYLLSVAVGPFDRIEREAIPANGVRRAALPLTGYTRRGKGAELDYILSVTPDYVKGFEEALQQPYPYEKLDIVAAPAWPSGATELAGAITYRESRILINDASGPSQIESAKQIHAHEISHMWFGNLVTPPWWNDLWLKEGFATWSEPMLLSLVEPNAGHDIDAKGEAIAAMKLDSLAAARAIAQPIERNEDIRNAYDSITYRKSMAVIHMVDAYFGPEKFRPALGKYVAAYEDKSANSDEFFKVIGDVTGEPKIENVFRSFVTRNGLPLITVSAPSGAQLSLTQSRFRPAGAAKADEALWTLPVCVNVYDLATASAPLSGAKKTCVLMDEATAALDIGSSSANRLIVPNANGDGYYRVAMDAKAWQALQPHLARLPAGETLMLLDSARATFETGALDASAFLPVLAEASAHGEERVKLEAISITRDLRAHSAGSPAAATLDRWIANTLVPELETNLEAGSAAEARILALKAANPATRGVASLRSSLVERLKAYMAGASGEFEPLTGDEFAPALDASLGAGGTGIVDVVLDVEAARDDVTFSTAVVEALSRVKDPAQQKMIRELIKSAALGPQATQTLAQGQMDTPGARDAMWAALKADFPGFLERLPAQSRRATPRLFQGFCDPARAADAKAMFAEHGALAEGHQQALNETVETLSVCAEVRGKVRAALSQTPLLK